MACVEFIEERGPAGPVIALQFALALGGVGPAVDQVDAKARADTLQGGGPVGRTVVDHELRR